MSRIGQLKAREVARALHKLGFIFIRQRGSHAFYQHPVTGKATVVPMHPGEDIGRGLLRAILKQADISIEDFTDAL